MFLRVQSSLIQSGGFFKRSFNVFLKIKSLVKCKDLTLVSSHLDNFQNTLVYEGCTQFLPKRFLCRQLVPELLSHPRVNRLLSLVSILFPLP